MGAASMGFRIGYEKAQLLSAYLRFSVISASTAARPDSTTPQSDPYCQNCRLAHLDTGKITFDVYSIIGDKKRSRSVKELR